MYFQSFGAVSIVKVNAAWFHLRERGTFGGIFGILISLGLYFAYDWSRDRRGFEMPVGLFFVPRRCCWLFFACRRLPARARHAVGQAGHPDFDTGDASRATTARAPVPVVEVFKKMLSHPVILIISPSSSAAASCARRSMQWYRRLRQGIGHLAASCSRTGAWCSCVAGILGGMFAGAISDHLFQSRRGPVSACSTASCSAARILPSAALATPALGWVVDLHVAVRHRRARHAVGTASMDFGGKKNTGVAVGIIDGFVYLGTERHPGLHGERWRRGRLRPRYAERRRHHPRHRDGDQRP
jgi:MFS transporter, OPA family, glycerol-3-phosphate transporter